MISETDATTAETSPSEAIEAPAPPPAPAPAPEAPRKTLEEWHRAKKDRRHRAACVAAGWDVEQREHAQPLTFTEAEYVAGLAKAGSMRLK